MGEVESALALETLDPEQEHATATALVQRRLAATRGLETAARVRRLAGMLARKGFPPGVAMQVVRSALEADDAEVSGLEVATQEFHGDGADE